MDTIRALVSEDLNIIEKRICDFAKPDNISFTDLNNFICGKSKRIRSIICLLYLKANGVNTNDKIIDLLYATELIHNASLLHDDVIDNSHIRRGEKTIYDKYGSKLSVVSGDYLMSVAVKLILSLNVSEISDIFLTATQKMSEAEIIQFKNRNCEISVEEYINVAKGKTASLFLASMHSVAVLSGIDKNKADNFAVNFGILFQLNNDMDKESIKNDRENGLKTAVNIIGIEKTLALKDNYKEELRKITVNMPDSIYKTGIEDLIKLL